MHAYYCGLYLGLQNTFSGILIEFCVSVFNLGMYVSGFFAFLVHDVVAINVKIYNDETVLRMYLLFLQNEGGKSTRWIKTA